MHRTLLFSLLAILCSACTSVPGSAPSTTHTLTVTAIPKPTITAIPPTATVIQSGPTRRPQIDPDIVATQVNTKVDASQITWSGSISPSVFNQLISQRSGAREAFHVPKSEEVFNVFARPVILAAYLYQIPSEEGYHARFLFYEPGGKWQEEVVPPFLYKMDFPLGWVGGHEEYGDYGRLTRDLRIQFEHPILPNKLSIAVFAADHCPGAKGVYQKLCAELDRQGIELPVDYETAKAMVMDQWDLAIQRTAEVGDIEQVVKQVNATGADWWEEERFVLFYLPYVSVCLQGTPPVCGTYISYEMRIDTFGLIQATETTPALTPEFVPEPYVSVDIAMNIRNGPGTEFDVVGQILPEKKYPVIGKHIDWWWIDLGNSQSGWIYAPVNEVVFVGNANAVRDIASSPLPTPTPRQACTSADTTGTSFQDMENARSTLISFFELLNHREYEKAAELYGGEYQGLRDWNPLVDPQDHAALLANGCEINGLECLQLKRIVKEEAASAAEYQFTVEFMNEDGTLFVRGPCCGGNETDMPPESQFGYTVIRDCAGEFLILGLPVDVP